MCICTTQVSLRHEARDMWKVYMELQVGDADVLNLRGVGPHGHSIEGAHEQSTQKSCA